MLVLYIFILMFTNSINHIKKNIHSTFINRISIITVLISIFLTINILNFQQIGKGISIYSGLFQITGQSQIVEILLLLVGLCILISWPHTVHTATAPLLPQAARGREKVWEAKEQYSLVAIFSIVGGSLLMSSLDLLSMYLSIELQSFALYILATLNKDSLTSTSAGLKYFLLGSLSSCFILLGSAIIYSYTGLTQFEAMNSLITVSGSGFTFTEGDSGLINTAFNTITLIDINKAFTIGLVIIITGFLFKISAAPFYQWAPDVYDGTPTIVTVWLTLIVKLTILTFLLSFFEFTYPCYSNYALIEGSLLQSSSSLFPPTRGMGWEVFPLTRGMGWEGSSTGTMNIGAIYPLGKGSAILKSLLLISSLLSLLVGTIVGLSQIKVKRLLAFSSISHVGFLLLALSIYTQKSIDSFIFYLVQYSITNLNIFLILLAFGYLSVNASLINPNIEEGQLINRFFWSSNGLNQESQGPVKREPVQGANDSDINYLVELKGAAFGRYKNPILSISLALCLFSMAGIPPLIGFFSKQFVLFSSIENGNYFLSVVAVLISVISASYYLKLIKLTFFDSADKNLRKGNALIKEESSPVSLESLVPGNLLQPFSFIKNNEGLSALDFYKKPATVVSFPSPSSLLPAVRVGKAGAEQQYVHLSKIHSYIISILSCIILFFFLDPSIILNVTQLISLTIFNL